MADKYIDRKKGQDHESMWHRSILDTVGQAEKRGLVLYGAGFWGKIACRLFKKLGVQPLCYCDDAADKQEELCQGLTVYSFEKAVRVFPGAVYIVCVDSMRQVGKEKREHLDHMIHKLKDAGVYDSHCELHIVNYIFLLDMKNWAGFTDTGCQGHFVKEDEIHNLLILNHMSNSGSFYFEQLLDGHPNIIHLPCVNKLFEISYEKRLQYLEGKELLIEIAAQMLGYFHSKYEDIICAADQSNGIRFCMDKQGGIYSWAFN